MRDALLITGRGPWLREAETSRSSSFSDNVRPGFQTKHKGLTKAMQTLIRHLLRQPNRQPPTCFECGYQDSQREGWYDRKTGELAPGFSLSKGDVCVDVGCGQGGASMFAARQKAEVIATDISPEVITRIEEKFARLRTPWRAFVSDTDPLPLADGIATRVIAMEVLEHVESPDRFVAELVRIGQPEALYLISVPDERAEAVQQQVAPPVYWQPPNHLRVFAAGELEDLLKRHGLVIERQLAKSFFWAVWWILFWAADQDLREPERPLLQFWTRTWHELLKTPRADHVRRALDECMPKSRVIVARKPGAFQ
ncbi:MAG: class I SAM-dependent methyltransferase [Planctomycetia bacterium]|jgi:2-polyprenyl-3-methyl-5-hydroxy-6-metoxy-1,4-benzoquinol methylase|nr:class I SAM-dependent methyltransferase [Planctomycetia bacterium]